MLIDQTLKRYVQIDFNNAQKAVGGILSLALKILFHLSEKKWVSTLDT